MLTLTLPRIVDVPQADRDELAEYLDEQDRAWLASQGVDVEAELQELQDGMADEDHWRSGGW